MNHREMGVVAICIISVIALIVISVTIDKTVNANDGSCPTMTDAIGCEVDPYYDSLREMEDGRIGRQRMLICPVGKFDK